MKRIIIALALSFVLLVITGCTPAKNVDSVTTAPETQSSADTTVSDTTATPEAEEKIFEYVEVDGGYCYNLYNFDGSVAEEDVFCEDIPSHELIDGKLSKIVITNETYYFDHGTKAFSETFTDVFDENGTLLIRCEGDKVIVCDIFNAEGFYKEFFDFSYGIAADDPFVSCSFIDGGGSLKVEYLTEDGEERLECFNITNGTRCVIIEDWKNQKELMSGADRDAVEGFLRSYMGTSDYNTGFDLAYEVSGSLTINGDVYYHCECFYVMVEEGGEEKLVSCAEFVLSENHDKRYDCRDKDGDLIVYTENNMI